MAPKSEGRQVGVRIPADVLAQIDQRCVKTGKSRAETIRLMLKWTLEQQAKR